MKLGKDKDDIFWKFGKIHGLENIAFVDPKDLEAAAGNPVRLQKLVNDVEGSKLKMSSFEHSIDAI